MLYREDQFLLDLQCLAYNVLSSIFYKFSADILKISQVRIKIESTRTISLLISIFVKIKFKTAVATCMFVKSLSRICLTGAYRFPDSWIETLSFDRLSFILPVR